jgi:hypothetical protein
MSTHTLPLNLRSTIFQTLIASGGDFDGERIKARYLGTGIEKPKMFLEVFEEHNREFEKLVDKALMSFRTLQKFRTVHFSGIKLF